MAPDQPLLYVNRIVLPVGLQGRLDPTSWKCLLAAALALKLNRKWVLLGDLGMLSSLIAVLVAIAIFVPLAVLIVIPWSPLFLIFALVKFTRWWSRKWAIKSDRQAAALVGSDKLLSVLTTVRELASSIPLGSMKSIRFRKKLLRLADRISQIEKWKRTPRPDLST